jgi:hypothetical protein
VLGPERRFEGLRVAREVSARVTDPARVRAATVAASHQTNFPQTVRWDPIGVAEGDAGVAMLCGYLDACFPDEGWDAVGHRLLDSCVSALERVGVGHSGLFGGLSGLALAALTLSRAGRRYQRLLRHLDRALLPSAIEQADALASRRGGLAVGDFDLVTGVTGVGAYLLARKHERGVMEALRRTLGALVWLAGSDGDMPRWWTPRALLAGEDMVREFPDGNLNCGLAHGIPGPLALLALASREGVEVEGQATAMREIAEWLVEQRIEDEWGVNWPSAVPALGRGLAGPGAPPRPTRSAWCYGSPGIACALWLAGSALADSDLCSLAVDAIEAVHRRPLSARNIDSPTFCHGVAGLLQITLRFAQATGTPMFADAADALAAQLLAAYEPGRLLGYAALEPGGNPVDRAGVLDGAAGVAMVLLAAGTDAEPSWDRLFLLA